MRSIIVLGTLLVGLQGAVAGPLTVGQCLDIYTGLAAFDHYDRVAKDDKGEHIISSQYKLGATRLTIAMNLAALKPVVEATDKARLWLVAEMGGEAIKANSPQYKQLSAEDEKVRAANCSAQLETIDTEQLKLGDGPDENPIPPGTLSLLVPILSKK